MIELTEKVTVLYPQNLHEERFELVAIDRAEYSLYFFDINGKSLCYTAHECPRGIGGRQFSHLMLKDSPKRYSKGNDVWLPVKSRLLDTKHEESVVFEDDSAINRGTPLFKIKTYFDEKLGRFNVVFEVYEDNVSMPILGVDGKSVPCIL